jgi:multicomponent Na+:H+ antiporter subunit D
MIEAGNPIYSLIVPLLGAVGIVLFGRLPNLREAVTLITAAILFTVTLGLMPAALAGDTPRVVLFDMVPGMPIMFQVEGLGMIYALIASGLWILNSLYSIGYMRANGEKHQTRFYLCFAIAIFGAMGTAFAGNFFTLFVFYEVLTLSTFPLVTHKGSKEAVQGGRVYLGILASASIGLLFPALIWIQSSVGHVNFELGGILADSGLKHWQIALLFFLCVYGVAKAALMPLHRWLPAAMVAPTPVSALLHAVAVVKAGVFSVIKISVYIFGYGTLGEFGGGDWLIYMAGFTIVTASFIALFQDNLKRRLAYSTVSQLSYILLAVGLWVSLGPDSEVGQYALIAAAVHIPAHAFGKITLFFAAGSIYTAAHKTKVSELRGIGKRMPWTMGAFAVGALAMIGAPPTSGFISKWFLLTGAWEARSSFAIGVILVSTLLNAAYFLPVLWTAFFCKEESHRDEHGAASAHGSHHGEAPWPVVAALTGTALLSVSFFFYPDWAIALARTLIPG